MKRVPWAIRAGLRSLAGLFLAVTLADLSLAQATPCHSTPPGQGMAANVPWQDYLPRDRVRLHFIEQSTFVIGTRNVMAVADFAGFISHDPDILPTVITMNSAHLTHKTDRPDPRIPHVLRGWSVDGIPARHRLELPEMVIRNVTTDTLGTYDDQPPVMDGNSVLVFEAAGLCIGHFSHLQTALSPAQQRAIGHLDVAIVPVDNGWAMEPVAMAAIAGGLGAKIIIPSHWFSETTLEVFLSDLSAEWEVVEIDQASVDLSPDTLPATPMVMVLRPGFLPCASPARC
ncbi:MAG: Zn-dependent hydrolase [Rhodobacteraceae bacterium PARR1]|nr:MAG: Zn-dependent hydrolase [Rhodobacteraceae bacterium PARR1]